MKRLSIERADILGHSHGGRVSIALAAHRPQLLHRMVLVDSAGIRAPRTLSLRLRGLTARTARRVLSNRLAGEPGRRALQSLYARMGMSDYANAGPLRATLVRIVNEDLTGLLSSIAAPTLVVWGADDRETPPWMGEQIASGIADSRLVVLPDAGHYAYIDRPEPFLTHVLEFLQPPDA